MKSLKLKTAGLLLLSFFIFGAGTNLFAQEEKEKPEAGKVVKEEGLRDETMKIPNLSEDQKTKIKALKLSLMKETLPLKNQLSEKKAHLKTLETADKSDLTAINATIDEISALKTAIAKKRAASKQEVRKLLNDDQRVFFDTQLGDYGKDKKPGRGNGQMRRPPNMKNGDGQGKPVQDPKGKPSGDSKNKPVEPANK